MTKNKPNSCKKTKTIVTYIFLLGGNGFFVFLEWMIDRTKERD